MKPEDFYRIEGVFRYILDSILAVERDIARKPSAEGVVGAFGNYKFKEKFGELDGLVAIVPSGLEVLQTLRDVLCDYIFLEHRVHMAKLRGRPAEKRVGTGTLLYHLELVGKDFDRMKSSKFFEYEEKLLPIVRGVVGLVSGKEYYKRQVGVAEDGYHILTGVQNSGFGFGKV